MCAQALLAVAAARPVPATAAPPAVTASQPVEALSGRLEIITGFGDERLAIAEPGTKQPEHYPLTARISRIWGNPAGVRATSPLGHIPPGSDLRPYAMTFQWDQQIRRSQTGFDSLQSLLTSTYLTSQAAPCWR